MYIQLKRYLIFTKYFFSFPSKIRVVLELLINYICSKAFVVHVKLSTKTHWQQPTCGNSIFLNVKLTSEQLNVAKLHSGKRAMLKSHIKKSLFLCAINFNLLTFNYGFD